MIREALNALRLKWRRMNRRRRVARAEEQFETCLAKLGPGDLAIDCGANVGLITTRLAATGATVHAFEPDPDAFRDLAAATRDLSNVILHNAAVGTAAARATLYASRRRQPGTSTGSSGSSLLTESRRVTSEPLAEVAVVDFAAFLDTLPSVPRLTKIDIEGAEIDLLNMLFDRGWMERLGPVFVETHEKQIPAHGASVLALIDRAAATPGTELCLDWG